MIWKQEHKNTTPSHAVLSYGHTPIFAVSGILRRGDERQYADAGFDGWMPKPIDMKRLMTYLAGAWDAAVESVAHMTISVSNLEDGCSTRVNTNSSTSPARAATRRTSPSPRDSCYARVSDLENAPLMSNQAETPRVPHGAEAVPEAARLVDTLNDDIAPEDIPGAGSRRPRHALSLGVTLHQEHRYGRQLPVPGDSNHGAEQPCQSVSFLYNSCCRIHTNVVEGMFGWMIACCFLRLSFQEKEERGITATGGEH
jgi:hypothetical protein